MGSFKRDSRINVPSLAKRERPLIVIGITHPQTCLVLTGRLRALRESGYRVVVISSPGDLLHEVASREGVESLSIQMERGIAPLSDLVSLFRLARALYRLRPDIAEFSTPKAGLLGSLAAILCGVPCRVYMLRGLRLETASGPLRWILLGTERIAARCCHVVLCNSRSLRDQAVRLHLADEKKLQLLGYGSSNGVDVDRFSPGPTNLKARLGIPAEAPVIGFVGRLTRDKGVPELIRAFDVLLKSVPDARLLLVGWYDESEDALSPKLRSRIDQHPNILRTGYVTDTAPYYRVMDMMVLPTRREGFPNVVLEASATAIPVIATLATGSRDAVLPEVTGLLVPAGHPEAMTEAMLQLLANPARRRRMGEVARRWVMERFRHTRVHALTVAMFEDMLQAGSERQLPAHTKEAAAAAD
jgi:glycosyltransferase involved in cell wall biosynthesis